MPLELELVGVVDRPADMSESQKAGLLVRGDEMVWHMRHCSGVLARAMVVERGPVSAMTCTIRES